MIDLEAIRKRCEAATPEPWYMVMVADDPVICTGPGYDYPCVFGNLEPQPGIEGRKVANGDFAAHARTDLPAVLDLVEELERKGQDLCNSLGSTMLECADLKATHEELIDKVNEALAFSAKYPPVERAAIMVRLLESALNGGTDD